MSVVASATCATSPRHGVTLESRQTARLGELAEELRGGKRQRRAGHRHRLARAPVRTLAELVDHALAVPRMASGIEADALRCLAVRTEVVRRGLNETGVVSRHERGPKREPATLAIAQVLEDDRLRPLPPRRRVIGDARRREDTRPPAPVRDARSP